MKGIEPHYTFLGRDAIRALKEWVIEREKYVNRDNCGYIFITSHGNPLTYPSLYHSWMRVLRRLKLIPEQQKGTFRRYGKNLHELRDFYRTWWQKSPASQNVGEFFMGHKIDKLEYNKAFLDIPYMKQEYCKAEPFLNVISQDPTKVDQYELIRKQNQHKEQIETLTNALQTSMETIEFLKIQLESFTEIK